MKTKKILLPFFLLMLLSPALGHSDQDCDSKQEYGLSLQREDGSELLLQCEQTADSFALCH